jgi:hypothetical protein
VAAVAVGVVALLQVHGLTGRSTGELRTTPEQLAVADDLLHAATAAAGVPDPVLVRADGALHPMNAQQWLLALTGTWTLSTQARAEAVADSGTPADVVARALEAGATLVVAPEDVAALGLGAAPAGRVVTWG